MNIERVGVVGAGTMGNGIAHVFARGGYDVVLCDVEQRFLDRGFLDRLLLSQDVCMLPHLYAYGGTGYDYLLTGFTERLCAEDP